MKALLLLAIPVALIGCSKSSNKNSSTNNSSQASFTDRRWQLSDETATDANGQLHTDLWASEPDYIKDDFIIWHTGNTYMVSDGTKLQPGATTSIEDTGTWAEESQTLTMASILPGVTNTPLKLITITDSTLATDMYNPDKKITVHYYYKKI